MTKIEITNFSEIHIDAKFNEEAEYGVISMKTPLENSQKIRFIIKFGNFNKIGISENLRIRSGQQHTVH